jgi:CHAT domain
MRTVLLRIEECSDGFRVTLFRRDGDDWLDSPIATGVLPADLRAEEANDLPGDGGTAALRAFLLGESGDATGFEAIGTYLHGLLDDGDVGAQWRAIDAPQTQGGVAAGVRLLLDVRAEQLASLPWELMCRGPRRFATDVTSPLVRVSENFSASSALRPIRGPLRVLVVVGSEAHDPVVDAEQEVRRLRNAFRRMCGLVDVQFLHQPLREEVGERYAELKPHIFHFIGHGRVQDGRGELILHHAGQNERWTLDDMDSDLAGWMPRLAILNACRTTSVEEQEGAWRVADVFVARGVPAVIAMQADIRGDAAARFTGGLYAALAEGKPLDVAVTHGRNAITHVVDAKHRDFALPSLTVSAPPEQVMDWPYGVKAHRAGWLRAFVDRTEERRRLWRDLDPDPDVPKLAAEPPGAIAILGDHDVGKSELARWCVGAFQLGGGNAAYVDLSRGERLPFMKTLEIIGDALARADEYGDQNQRAFKEWSDLTRPLNVGLANGGEAAPPMDALESTFEYFADALRTAADDGPLLIALDHVNAVQAPDWDLLCTWLLEPIARRKLDGVSVIIALSDSGSLPNEVQEAMEDPVVLGRFRATEYEPIASQYLGYHSDVELELLDRHLEQLPVGEEFGWPDVIAHAKVARLMDWEQYR